MINKLKIGLFVAVLVMFGGFVNFASAANLTWGADQTVDMSSPDVDLTILSGSSATGLVINAGTVLPTIVTDETFTITSRTSDFTVSPIAAVGDTYTINQTCVGGLAKVILTGGTSQQFTITPTGTACVNNGGSSSGGSSGGGGGSVTSTVAQSSTPVAVQVTPQVTVTTVDPGCSGNNKYNTSTGALCVNNTSTNTTVNNVSTTSGLSGVKAITTNLSLGKKGASVKALQEFLNNNGFPVSTSGVGSKGYETTTFGKATKAALIKWQLSVGITPATGTFGPKSRAYVSGL